MKGSQRKISILILSLIGLAFLWTGSGFLSWVYQMSALFPSSQIDYLAESGGYLMQAAGLCIAILNERYFHAGLRRNRIFTLVSILGFILLCLARFSYSAPVILIFGYAMNLLFGMIAAYYLNMLAAYASPGRIGLIFGAGYACGSILSFLLSLPGENNFLTKPGVFAVYAGILIATLLLSRALGKIERTASDCLNGWDFPKQMQSPPGVRLLLIASITVLLLSCVNSSGSYFPFSSTTDSPVSLELSRAFYAVGLIAAGLINDKKRSVGAILCVAAMCFPFLTVTSGSYPGIGELLRICGYIFFGFYAVYRVILFVDFARMRTILYTASIGLLCGRIGDALGAYLGIRLSGQLILLVSVIAGIFTVCIFLFFALYQKLYMQPEPTMQDRIQAFAVTYELSRRETELLRLVLQGMSNKDIANQLFISENTVKFHMRNLLRKTGCDNRKNLNQLFANSDK